MDSGKVLASALILSHFDYGNALLTGLPKSTLKPMQLLQNYAGLPKSTLKPMQLLQNYAAKVLTKRCKYDSATESLKELHWFPIQQRCEFKTLLMTYKALNNLAPPYISELLVLKTSAYRTRSSSDNLLLEMPFTRRKTFYDRSFTCLSAKLWNNLPYSLRSSENVVNFKKNLKTHMFRNAFKTE